MRFGHSRDTHPFPPLIVGDTQRVARRTAADTVRKHCFWPVPSYGLREAMHRTSSRNRRKNRAAEGSAPRQLHVQDEPRGPKFDRRALPYQHPHDRLTFLPDGHVLRIEELRARLYSLVLARQVHPKEDPTHLGSGLALSELVFADPFGVPHAAPRSELQERSGLQPRAPSRHLDRCCGRYWPRPLAGTTGCRTRGGGAWYPCW